MDRGRCRRDRAGSTRMARAADSRGIPNRRTGTPRSSREASGRWTACTMCNSSPERDRGRAKGVEICTSLRLPKKPFAAHFARRAPVWVLLVRLSDARNARLNGRFHFDVCAGFSRRFALRTDAWRRYDRYDRYSLPSSPRTLKGDLATDNRDIDPSVWDFRLGDGQDVLRQVYWAGGSSDEVSAKSIGGPPLTTSFRRMLLEVLL